MNNLTSIGIIPDGNRRYGRKKKIKQSESYKKGINTGIDIIEHIYKEYKSIKQIFLYTLSKENLNRNQIELKSLLYLFETNFPKIIKKIEKYDISVKFIGNFKKLPKSTLKMINNTNNNFKKAKLVVYLCVGYTGRTEIIDGINQLLKEKRTKITEDGFKNYLYDKDMIFPQIIVRTSGTYRLSGFLTYQSAYSELFFVKKLWPEFKKRDLDKLIEDYTGIKRNFGK